jgi:K+-sensing histidine kinase KdpD
LLGISEDITERKQTEENERKQRILAESLREIASALTSTLNLDQVLDNILANASHVVPHDMASIMLIDEKDEAYIVRERGYAEFGLQDKLLSVRFPLAMIPHLQEIVRTAKPVVVPDTANAPGWVLGLGSPVVRSWAGIPIRQKDKVIGVINFDSLTTGFFNQDFVYPLQVFADQAAIAVANAQFATQLEERVAQRTAELAAANRELEGLSYNIAHDMRSPVRAMVAYSGILQRSHRAQLDSEGVQLLENIHTAGMRLGQMIDSFLTFLHLGHTTIHLQSINVTELIGNLLPKWKAELENRQVEFKFEDLPACQADFRLLEKVWEQLLANALKFTRSREVARIEIGSGEQAGNRYYFVRDNGVGFDMKYADKLFGVFQKLHHESEFEGLGIGLAIARRIVQSHGGKMWAEAGEDQGATFYFTLRE